MQNINKGTWKKKRFIIPLILIVFFITVRIVLGPVLLSVINKEGKTKNPQIEGRAGGLDLAILRGRVHLENVSAKLKKDGREFFRADDILLDLAWTKLLRGEVSFDVLVNDFDLKVKKDLLGALKKLPKPSKEEKEKREREGLPVTISKITIKDSKISFPGYPGLANQKVLSVDDIEGIIRNISGEKGSPLSTYKIEASLGAKNNVSATGSFDTSADPVRWDLNGKLIKFNLPSLNKLLTKELPANYKKGTLDVYSEVKSENGKIYGYVKPFMNDVEMMGNKQEWKGPKHFFIELLGSLTNTVLENSKKKSVATRVPFIYQNGAFSVETGEAIADAIKHGLLETDTVKRSVENKYQLNKPNPKEVQAQEEDLKKEKKDQ